METRSSC